MSDSPPAREWRFYLEDMIAFTEKVLSYTDGLDQAGFGKKAVFPALSVSLHATHACQLEFPPSP